MQTTETPAPQTGQPAWLALLPPAAVAAWAAAMMFNPRIFRDPDTNWHLATGDLILRTGRVPDTDPFSWSAAGQPWVAHEWLAEVVMALIYRATAWQGLAVLMSAALGTILIVVALRAGQALAPQRAVLAAAIVAAGLAPATLVRPHLIAYVLLTGWTILLIEARRANRAPPLWSALLLALWVNLHGSFIIAIAIAGAFGLEALVHNRDKVATIRQWGLFGGLCLAATLANPHGALAWLYPFQVSGMKSLHMITEWQPLNPRTDVLQTGYIGLIGLCIILWHRRFGLVRTALLSGLLVMAVLHGRHQAVFAIVSSLVVLDMLRTHFPPLAPPARWRRGSIALAVALIAGAGLARLLLPIERANANAYPVRAIAAVPATIRATNVINFYDFGGALILNGLRPYIDGRADMYGDAHMAEYASVIAGNPAAFASVTQDGKVGWLMLRPDNGLLPHAERLGWQRLHADRFAVVLVRPDLAAQR